MRRCSKLVVLILVAAGALAACTSGKSGTSTASTTSGTPVTSASSTATTSASAPSSTPASTASHSSAATATHASTPQCLSDIRVIPGATQGAAGHIILVLIFNNVSRTTTCEMIGYPGVDLVTASGATVAHLTRTLRGYAGGEPVGVTAPQAVILAPGASASAVAEASDVPQGGITNCGNYSLLITVPNQFASVGGGTAMLPRCDAQIHPVVPGTTGGLG